MSNPRVVRLTAALLALSLLAACGNKGPLVRPTPPPGTTPPPPPSTQGDSGAVIPGPSKN